jgi:peptide deformylase
MKRAKKKLPTEEEIEDVGELIEETEGLTAPDPETLMDCGDGEVLPILSYPDPILREKCVDIVEFGEPLRKLVADLTTTMYARNGIGLAAPQVGISKRVFVLDLLSGAPQKPGRPPSQLLVVVNPKVWRLGKIARDAERCLSFPGAVEVVSRSNQITLKAFTYKGEPFAMSATATLGRAIQHEYDHLDGKLIIDHLAKKKAKALREHMKRRLPRR